MKTVFSANLRFPYRCVCGRMTMIELRFRCIKEDCRDEQTFLCSLKCFLQEYFLHEME